MNTLAAVEQRYGITHLDHLDRGAEIPLITRLAFQGDVAVSRRDHLAPSTTPIPAAGHPVVRGENGGNTHALFGAGFFTPQTAATSDLVLGTLTVPEGEQVLLSHPEHGGLLIGPGTYGVSRQREQANIIRRVAD